ncbi:MAG: hypothetical protein WCU80_12125 [Paludibacteraceae bacterium]
MKSKNNQPRIIRNLVTALIFVSAMFYKVPIFAAMTEEEAMSSLQNQAFYVGTKTLIAVGTGALTTLLTAAGVFLIIGQIGKYNTAQNEEKAKHKKRGIEITIGTVAVLLVGGILTWIFAIYGVSAE